MRSSASTLSYFHRALLLTLASLPACGGLSSAGIPGGGPGQPDAASPADAGSPGAPDAAFDAMVPTTPCNWAVQPVCQQCPTDCSWNLLFQGDPQTCVGTGYGSNPTTAQCAALCGSDPYGQAPPYCVLEQLDAGVGLIGCEYMGTPQCPTLNGGRRPAFFASLGFGPVASGRELGTHFARAACMEAGSIVAFRSLRDELHAHRAPRRLVRAAQRAVRDETRHVRQTASLARRFGEEPIAPPPIPRASRRSLEALALENAVEGCVRETYSALECAWQAHVAADPAVRATMKRIARDEMRHLDLSWAVHAWALGRLDAGARARLLAAQRAEIATLLGELSSDPPASLCADGGLPPAAQSRALVDAIARRLAPGMRARPARSPRKRRARTSRGERVVRGY